MFKSLKIVMCLFLGSCITNTQTENEVIIAKQTVQKTFRISLMENLDSFKNLMPNVVWWKWSDDYLKMRIDPIKLLAQKEGIPSINELQGIIYNLLDVKLCKVKYIPKGSVTIDSIIFSFDRYEGSAKISSFEVFERDDDILKKINTLPPGTH